MIRPLIIGFATTLKHFFRKKITVNYPDEKIPVFPKWRGKQVLMRDEDGLEKMLEGRREPHDHRTDHGKNHITVNC